MLAKRRREEEADGLVTIEQEPVDLDYRLPLWRKICFAIGGAPYQTTNTVINFFISIFLLEVAEISPEYISIVLFVGKVWDAVTDPTCGYLVHRFNSRLGKFRPWILFSAPFACGAYFCLWYVPDLSEVGKFGWYFVFYCSFQALLSGLHVPYTSLTMAVTTNQKDRDSVTAYRMVSEAVGVLVAVVVQGQLVSKTRKTGDCGDDDKMSEKQLEDEKTESPSHHFSVKWSYTLGAIVVVAAYLFCACTVFFGVKERKGMTTADKGNFFTGLKMVLTFKPYLILSGSFLFLSLAVAIVQGNLALFCTHSLHLGDYFSYFILVLLTASQGSCISDNGNGSYTTAFGSLQIAYISAILAMPVWQRLLIKFGKKTTFAAGMIILLPTLIAQLYITDNKYIFFPVLVLAGLGVSVALLLPWSMLPDVLDEFMLTTGCRKDAIFYSFYVFFNKLSVGIGLGISQGVLALGGYKTGECEQPESVGLALRLLVAPGPVVFVLIALILLWKYPIDERRRREIRLEVEKRRKRQHVEEKEEKKGKESTPIPSFQGNSKSYESITISSGV